MSDPNFSLQESSFVSLLITPVFVLQCTWCQLFHVTGLWESCLDWDSNQETLEYHANVGKSIKVSTLNGTVVKPLVKKAGFNSQWRHDFSHWWQSDMQKKIFFFCFNFSPVLNDFHKNFIWFWHSLFDYMLCK